MSSAWCVNTNLKKSKPLTQEEPMDTSIPNDDERKKLQKMAKFDRHLSLYVLCLFCIYFIDEFFIDKYPILDVLANILMFAFMFYLLLNFALLKRCPRCSSRGTPLVGGNCPKCGLRLDPLNK